MEINVYIGMLMSMITFFYYTFVYILCWDLDFKFQEWYKTSKFFDQNLPNLLNYWSTFNLERKAYLFLYYGKQNKHKDSKLILEDSAQVKKISSIVKLIFQPASRETNRFDLRFLILFSSLHLLCMYFLNRRNNVQYMSRF